MKSIQMRGVFAAVSGALLLSAAPMALADSTDDIINALVGKGVLTEEEGALLMKGRSGEKEAAEKKKESEIKASFKDGIKWESGDKAHSIKLDGRVQLDYRNIDDEYTKNGANRNTVNGWDVRRAYFGVSGVFSKYYDFKVVANFADADNTGVSKSSQLDEAYFGINWWKQASFRFGQFKMPFSLEEQTSSRFIDFQERSMANNIVPGKEIGAMVHGEPTKGVFYALAFSTGEGKNLIENDTNRDDEGSDVIARVGANFAEIVGHENNVYHVAVAGSTGDQSRTMRVRSNSEARGYTFFDYNGVSGERDRLGAEAAFAFGPVKFQGEYITAKYDFDTPVAGKSDADIDVWYLSANWLITGEQYAKAYKAGKFDRIRPLTDFTPDGKGWGAWEVGARYSQFDASDFNGINAVGTETNEADSWTLGLKWIPTPNTRFLLNYVRTDFDTPVRGEDDEKAITFRTQFDF